MFSIGLVLSAGGPLGDPWHSGVLGRLQERTGWDARSADLITGTSAGAITAVTLRAGVAAIDRKLHMAGGPISPEAEDIYARIVTPGVAAVEDGSDPARHGQRPPWHPFGRAAREAHERAPSRWVARQADMDRRGSHERRPSGRVRARRHPWQRRPGRPLVVRGARLLRAGYIDGGVHSSTNLDVTAMLGFDLVIVSSAMSATPEARSWLTDPTRAWFSNKLDDEIATVRARGSAVVVIEPDATGLAALDKTADDARVNAANAGATAVDRVLSGVDGAGLTELIERGAAD
jgi:NTE family protein